MKCPPVIWAFVLASWAGGGVNGGVHHASIMSKYGQLVTSSTLRWVHANSGPDIPLESVPSGTGNSEKYICRAEHHGALLVGQTSLIGSHCVVGFVNRLYKKHAYELLINLDRAARLEWRPYSRYGGVAEGAVAAVDESSSSVVGDNDVFIGRHLSSDAWFPGAVEVPRRSASFGLMRVFNGKGQMTEENSGDILVETEPIRYQLELQTNLPDDEPRRTKKVVRSDVVLAKSSLFRFDEGKDIEARMQKVLSYEYEKSEYYGQIPGMIRALPASIRLPNGQVQSVLWGLPEKSVQHETIMVGHALQHFRAVDVSVVGVRITEETPYRASLTAVFPDGSRRERHIEGVVQRIYLDNIRPEYSRVYHIKEASKADSSQEGASTTTFQPGHRRPKEDDSFHYQQPQTHYRDNELRDNSAAVGGQKRQTKAEASDQQQLLMPSSSSSSSRAYIQAVLMVLAIYWSI
eukprot:10170.XXX_280210_281716_1 [CDS] Oithona nana genome sequencing.